MEKPIAIFRKSFFYSTFTVMFIAVLLRIYPFMYSLNYNENRKGFYTWIIQGSYTTFLSLLLSLIVPWIMLSFFGEWFYTRSLNRQNLFKMIWNEYIIWFSAIVLLLIICVELSQAIHYNSTDEFYLAPTLLLSSLTMYLVIILAGNTKTLTKIITYGIPVFIFSAFFGDFNINNIQVGNIISWFLWISYLIYSYKIVSDYDDVDLNVPGKADDENRSMSNLWFYSKEFGKKEISLASIVSPLGKFFSQFRLITIQSKSLYTQLILIFSLIVLFFSIKYVVSIINIDNIDLPTSWSWEKQVINTRLDIIKSDYTTLLGMLMLISGLSLILINSRYLFMPKEEFLLTRPISRNKIYLYNYFTQIFFVSLIVLFTYLIFRISFYEEIFENLNYFTVIITILWFILAGEVGIIMLFFLSSLDIASTLLSNSSSAEYTFSFIINLHTMGIFSISLWLGALFFRYVDYLYFINKEIGWFRGFKFTIKEISLNYLPPLTLLLVIVLFTTYKNPLTIFFNSISYDKYQFTEFAKDIKSSIFYKPESQKHKAINDLLYNPYNQNAYLNLAEEYVNENLDWFYSFRFYNLREDSLFKAKYWLNLSDDLKTDNQYLYNSSRISFFEGNYQEALKLAEKSVTYSDNSKYYSNLATIYEAMFYNSKAINAYKKAIEVSKMPDGNTYKKIGDIYWNNRIYDKALDYYALAVIKDNKVFFPYRSYYYHGLCDKIFNLTKNYSNINLLKDTELTIHLCEDREANYKRFKRHEYRNYSYSHDVNVEGAYGADRGLYSLKKGTPDKALLSFRSGNYDRYFGDIALIQISMGDKKSAKKTIESYLNAINHRTKNNPNDLKRTFYDSKIYLAMMKLDETNISMNTAKFFLISSPDTKEAWFELKKLFSSSPSKLKELEVIKNEYEKLYSYFEEQGMTYISNSKSVERTKLLLKDKRYSNKSKITEIINKIH